MPESSDRQAVLNYCRSRPHRAVIGLVAVALGEEPPRSLKKDLTQSKPEQLAQLVNYNQVHTVVRRAFAKHPELTEYLPKDLLVYFRLMYSENKKRNQEAKEELTILGELFHKENIEAVVLKGGAEILCPYYQDPACRFISDLDILIPENRIQDAAEILYARGGTSSPAGEPEAYAHHHLPGISGGELPFTIELHRRIGKKPVDSVLPAGEIFSRSLPGGIKGLRIPCPEDRFIHHVLHAQISSRLYERKLLNLRNCVDHLSFLHALDKETQERARMKLDRHGLLPMLEGLDTLACWIFPGQTSDTEPASKKWAAKTLRNFGRPGIRKYLDTFVWVRGYATRFFTDPECRRHYIRKALNARGWAQMIAFHKERLHRFK